MDAFSCPNRVDALALDPAHFQRCQRIGGTFAVDGCITATHHSVRDILHNFLVPIGFSSWREVEFTFGDETLIMDIVCSRGGQTFLIDITISHPECRSSVMFSSSTTGSASDFGSHQKFRKYADLAKSLSRHLSQVVPFAMEYLGYLHMSSVRWLKSVCAFNGLGASSCHVPDFISANPFSSQQSAFQCAIQSISITLQSHISQRISSQISHAFLKELSYLHL